MENSATASVLLDVDVDSVPAVLSAPRMIHLVSLSGIARKTAQDSRTSAGWVERDVSGYKQG